MVFWAPVFPLCAKSWTWIRFLWNSGHLDSFINHTQNRFMNLSPSHQWCLLSGNKGCSCFAFLLQVLHAHLAAADPRPKLSCFQSFRGRSTDKLLWLLNSGQPEAVLVCKVVACSPGTIAFNEGCSTEILQARTRWDKRLTSTLCTSCCVLK